MGRPFFHEDSAATAAAAASVVVLSTGVVFGAEAVSVTGTAVCAVCRATAGDVIASRAVSEAAIRNVDLMILSFFNADIP
jgi:hypothetical protein